MAKPSTKTDDSEIYPDARERGDALVRRMLAMPPKAKAAPAKSKPVRKAAKPAK